jgi:polyvinyl alcohol dehydrogenase (cytochrome)
MQRAALLAIAITGATLLSACSPAKKTRIEEPSGQTEFGERLYLANCAGCHDKSVGGAPTRQALESKSAANILAALNSGIMKTQAAALKPLERYVLSEHLGKPAAPRAETGPRCGGSLSFSGPVIWNRWGNSKRNTRFQDGKSAGLDSKNVADLELAWAFGFPDAQRARSQPAVTKEALFTGSQSGRVYALGTADGCIWWTYEAGAEVRTAPVIGTDTNGLPETVYFADIDAVVHAVDARTGKKKWSRNVRDHPDGTITGSLSLHGGKLIVPMSSMEVLTAYDPDYKCCTFRGGVLALSAHDGSRLWRWYTVETPKRSGKNSKGVANFAPSGAPVWSTPTIDAKRGLIYVGTGENYSSPANGNSDAIVALSIADGRPQWVRQTVSGDAWNAACGIQPGANCPSEDGPDFDFGAPPILVTLASGKDILLAGQKSGEIFGIDPDDGGRILWRQRVGMGGFNGGIHWGMASDGRTLWVGIADTPGNRFTKGPPRQGVHAFDPVNGKPLWSRIERPTCAEGGYACMTAISAPVTAIPGVLFAGAHNGRLIAYSAADGTPLWLAETNRSFKTVNGVEAKGGTIDGAGPVVAGGMVFVNSGYDKFGEISGNVLLAFRVKREGSRK